MTVNQLQYWRNVETERHNRATEAQALLDYEVTQYDVYNNKALTAASNWKQALAAESQAATAALKEEHDTYNNMWKNRIAEDQLELNRLVGIAEKNLKDQQAWTELAKRQDLTASTYLEYEKRNESIENQKYLQAQTEYTQAKTLEALQNAGLLDLKSQYYGAEMTSEIVSNYVSAFVSLSGTVQDWFSAIMSHGISNIGTSRNNNAYNKGREDAYKEMYGKEGPM